MSWYRKVIADQTKTLKMLDYYNAQYMDGLNDLKLKKNYMGSIEKFVRLDGFRYRTRRIICDSDYF